MFTPTRTGQAAANSDNRCEIDSPRIAFFSLSRGKDDLGGILEVLDWASSGRNRSPTKNPKSMRDQNWTIWRWPVPLVYSHDQMQN